MNLLHYTYRNLSVVLFFLMTLWGVFFYVTIIDEILDETDDTLENYREILIGKALANPKILNTEDRTMHSYTIRPISEKKAINYRDRYYDSTVFIETEGEYEPVRILKSCFRGPDNNYYELELRLSTVERDDMVNAIFWYLLVLYIILLLCIMLGTRFVLKRIFRPLNQLLDWLKKVTPGQPAPVLNCTSPVHEFCVLGQAAKEMHERSERIHQEQKQFIENASHELQTPLAVLRGKLELLAEKEHINEKLLIEIDGMYRTLERAIKLNKSLLLLSRINNGHFFENTTLNLNTIIKETAPDLLEIYETKKITYEVIEENECTVCMNESLAQILIANLIKNAIVHNLPCGLIQIYIRKNSLEFVNSGKSPLDEELIFRRFYRSYTGGKESTGLGLSIARSIAKLYDFSLRYRYHAGFHSFVLKIAK